MDLKKKEVSTLLTKGQGNWESIRTIDFTLSGDTMLITNQQDTENAIGISYTTPLSVFQLSFHNRASQTNYAFHADLFSGHTAPTHQYHYKAVI